MAERDALHQETVQAIAQVTHGVGAQVGELSTVTAGNFAQLQEQIKYLEAAILALQAEVHALKGGG